MLLRVGNERIGPLEQSRDAFSSDQTAQWQGALPDPLPLEIWFRHGGHEVFWRSVPLYLDQSVAANGRLRNSLGSVSFVHEQQFDRGSVVLTYWAERFFEAALNGMARRCVVLHAEVRLHQGWTLQSSTLNALNAESHKLVLVVRWGREEERFGWRAQEIRSDHTLHWRRYTWRQSAESSMPLSERADRAADRERLWPTAASATITPRAQLQPYMGDTDTYSNPDSIFPLVVAASREGLRIVFFNMRVDPPSHAEFQVRMRQLARPRKSSCHRAPESDSSEEELEEGWWVTGELAPNLTARVRLRNSPAGGVAVTQVRLEAYKYQETLRRMAMVEPPHTI